MKKLGKIKTLTIASLSAVALAAPIAFAQSTGSTTQEDQKVMRGERHGGHGQRWGRGGRGKRAGTPGILFFKSRHIHQPLGRLQIGKNIDSTIPIHILSVKSV